MLRSLLAVVISGLTVAAGAQEIRVASTDWPWWRGPNRNGVANADQQPPGHWSSTDNVLWKAPLPGRSHGSVTVVGSRVFAAAADMERDQQSVFCFDRATGKQLWQTCVHDGGLTKKANKKATQASGTVACDGQRLFINFLNNKAVYTTALDLDGKQLWQTKITDYTLHQGYGSSPALYQSLVLVSADNKAGGALAALDRATGKIVWRHERPKTPNYPSPVVLNVAGKEQLLLTGCNLVSSYDPLTGKKNWEIDGATTECVTSTVTDGKHIFTSGGYPKNHMSAIAADGSGKVVWENNTRVYVPSMLVRDGYLYAVADAGVAYCYKSDTGEEVWSARLGGTFSSSPILVGDVIYATNEAGKTYLFKADPGGYELIAENELDGEVFATPAICGGKIYLRIAEQVSGKRQEMIVCLGKR